MLKVNVKAPVRISLQHLNSDLDEYEEAIYVRPALDGKGLVTHIFHSDGSMTGYFPEDKVELVYDHS